MPLVIHVSDESCIDCEAHWRDGGEEHGHVGWQDYFVLLDNVQWQSQFLLRLVILSLLDILDHLNVALVGLLSLRVALLPHEVAEYVAVFLAVGHCVQVGWHVGLVAVFHFLEDVVESKKVTLGNRLDLS